MSPTELSDDSDLSDTPPANLYAFLPPVPGAAAAADAAAAKRQADVLTLIQMKNQEVRAAKNHVKNWEEVYNDMMQDHKGKFEVQGKEIVQLKGVLEVQGKEIGVQGKEIARLHGVIEVQGKEIVRLEGVIEVQGKEIAQLNRKVERLEEINQSQDARFNRLMEVFSQRHDLVGERDRQISKQTNQIKTLTTSKASIEAWAERIQSAHGELTDEFEEQTRKLNAAVEELRQANEARNPLDFIALRNLVTKAQEHLADAAGLDTAGNSASLRWRETLSGNKTDTQRLDDAKTLLQKRVNQVPAGSDKKKKAETALALLESAGGALVVQYQSTIRTKGDEAAHGPLLHAEMQAVVERHLGDERAGLLALVDFVCRAE